MNLPAYGFAVISALLWALSAPILNYGLRQIPDTQKFVHLAVGLYGAMFCGLLVLAPFVTGGTLHSAMSGYVVLAGVFTYPLATGIYYLSGAAFDDRMELASQFAKVKPIFSIFISMFIIHEAYTGHTYISVVLICIGILLMLVSSVRGQLSRSAVSLGLLAAAFWALGELFVRWVVSGQSAININFIALLAGFVLSSFFVLPVIAHTGPRRLAWRTLWPFCVHGIISFGAAYAAFFESIRTIGLGKTVLINAFWPTLAVIITSFLRLYRGKGIDISLPVALAILLILSGSIVEALELILANQHVG
jgi:uncharacterized membrane protein